MLVLGNLWEIPCCSKPVSDRVSYVRYHEIGHLEGVAELRLPGCGGAHGRADAAAKGCDAVLAVIEAQWLDHFDSVLGMIGCRRRQERSCRVRQWKAHYCRPRRRHSRHQHRHRCARRPTTRVGPSFQQT